MRQSTYAPGETLVLGAYTLTIIRLLFVGGQAELYVVHGGPAPETVLKLYMPGARPKAEVLERWKTLSGSSIIQLFDADPHSQPRAWELLAYAAGGPLSDGSGRISTPIRDVARLRAIISQAADALHVLHTAGGIVHRDISPDNFLWLDTAQTQLVLADLGSASVMSGGAAKSGTIRGKAPFMPPEELLPMGDGVVIGEPADFYALGIVILTLWAGQHPFVGREADQIALKSRGATPMPADLPDTVRALVEALLLPANIRLDYGGVQRWLAGETLPRVSAPRMIIYPRVTVRPESGNAYEVETPAALAKFLREEPVAGEKFLYRWDMRAWSAIDAGLMSDLSDVVEKEFPQNREAGRQKAIHLLDSALPFQAPDGTLCRDYRELSAWIESGPDRPVGAIPRTHPLWGYLATRPEHDLRELVAGLDAEIRAGDLEATAMVRHVLMEFAAAGVWRDADGTTVADLTEFLSRAAVRQQVLLTKLRDPSDPLALWLESQVPDVLDRTGRLRDLPDQDINTLSADTWISCVVGAAERSVGMPLPTLDDCWSETLWSSQPTGTVSAFLHGWIPVVHAQQFESAAGDWLASRPQAGARHAVAAAILGGQWERVGRSLVETIGVAFRALPAWTDAAADRQIITVASRAVMDRIGRIASTSATSGATQSLKTLEAVTALSIAIGTHRSEAPEWWDQLAEALSATIVGAVRDAFVANINSTNLLGEIISWRGEIVKALVPTGMSGLHRFATEDGRRLKLEKALATDEATLRNTRIQAIGDQAITLRGLGHVETLKQLKALQPDRTRKVSRAALAAWGTSLGLLLPMYVLMKMGIADPGSSRTMLNNLAGPTMLLFWAMIAVFLLALPVGMWILLRTVVGRGMTVIGIGVAGYLLVRTLGRMPEPYVPPAIRVQGGIVIAVLLIVALIFRVQHLRALQTRIEFERDAIDPTLANDIVASVARVERAATASFGERWRWLHAVLAKAADPNKVALSDLPVAPQAQP